MDENERRQLQRLYEAVSASSTAYSSDANLATGARNSEVDDILGSQRHHEPSLQQEITSARATGNQQSEEQMNWLLRNNSAQQLLERNTIDQSNLARMSALSSARVLLQRINQMGTMETSSQSGLLSTDLSISQLLTYLQQQNNESELAIQNQQYRDLMMLDAVSRSNVGNIDIRSLLHSDNSLTRQQYTNLLSTQNLQQLSNSDLILSRVRANYDQSDLASSTQNLQQLSNSDLMLPRVRANYDQPDLASSTHGVTGLNVSGTDISQQLLMDQYLRPQQNDVRTLNQIYQNQQLLGSRGDQSRLAFLLQQREQLEHQSMAAMSDVPLNISLKNDELGDTEDLEVSKIRKVEAFIEKPKRPLSAYNIFFRQERQKLLGENDDAAEGGNVDDAKVDDDNEDKKPAAVVEQVRGGKKRKRGKPHHKVTFEQMAKIIGQRWKELESDEEKKQYYQDIAQKDKERYQAEIAAWKQQRNALSSKYRKKSDAP